jgi:hypothetical protein
LRLKFIVTTIIVTSLLIIGSTNLAHAQWSAISSGYGVTTDWHGQDAPIGVSVTATAGTTDMSVDKVEFRWLDPEGNVEIAINVTVSDAYITPATPADPPDNWDLPDEIKEWATDNPDIPVKYAQNFQTLDEVGDWAVQAHFIDTDHNPKSLRGRNTDIIAIRATSFNVVPEVPYGTIAILLSMFGALGLFAIRRKNLPAAMTG